MPLLTYSDPNNATPWGEILGISGDTVAGGDTFVPSGPPELLTDPAVGTYFGLLANPARLQIKKSGLYAIHLIATVERAASGFMLSAGISGGSTAWDDSVTGRSRTFSRTNGGVIIAGVDLVTELSAGATLQPRIIPNLAVTVNDWAIGAKLLALRV